MNKKASAFFCCLGVSFLSGCSVMSSIEDPVQTETPSKAQTELVENETSNADSSDLDQAKEAPLSEHQIESFPEWFSAQSLSDSTWTKIELNPSFSLSKNLFDSGIDTKWIESLRRSDFIDLSTFSHGQEAFVQTTKEGQFLSLYTPVNAQKAYYVDQTTVGPLMTIGPVSHLLEGRLTLSPETRLDDLSTVQRLALNDLMKSLLHIISHEAEVLLSKGTTNIVFEYLHLNREEFAHVKVKSAESRFDDFVMTYMPE